MTESTNESADTPAASLLPAHRPGLPERVFTRAEAALLGFGGRTLDTLIAEGAVRTVLRGALAPASLADTMSLRVEAARRVLTPGHIACDRTAAFLHGIDVHTWAEHDLLPPVETCVLPGRHPSSRVGVDARVRDLRPEDLTMIDELPVTTPLRTAIDLACVLRQRDALAALNEFARRYGVTAQSIAPVLPRLKGRRGVRQLRKLLPVIDARIESPRESWVLTEIHAAGLPLPEPQVWIEIGGVPTYRLDFAYRRARVCVEYDGAEFHDRSDEQREHDRRRRQWLRDHGWTVIVVRAGDFAPHGQARWIRRLEEALEPAYSNRRW